MIQRIQMKNIKKKVFILQLLFIILAFPIIAFAESSSYRYSNGYVMEYQLYRIQAGINGASGGTTSTENDATCFISIFSYNGSKVKNSAYKQQDYYVYLAIKNKGGTKAVSTHSLKYAGGKPCGMTKKITIY